MRQIVLQNFSSVISDHDLLAMIAALQTQVSRDFAPYYGIDAKLSFKKRTDPLLPTEELLAVFDTSDAAGALGYHDITEHGQPLGKVFAKDTIDDGGAVSVTLSHELLEMLADPWVNTLVIDYKHRRVYAFEVCDAVEADELGYSIGGVQVSDFVLPSYFESDSIPAPNGRSFRNNVSRCFSLAAGGYMSYLTSISGAWHQVFAASSASARAGRPGTSRGMLRRAWSGSNEVHTQDEVLLGDEGESEQLKGRDEEIARLLAQQEQMGLLLNEKTALCAEQAKAVNESRDMLLSRDKNFTELTEEHEALKELYQLNEQELVAAKALLNTHNLAAAKTPEEKTQPSTPEPPKSAAAAKPKK